MNDAAETQTIPRTMRAWTQERYGLDHLREAQRLLVPIPGEGQVLLRVHATSINSYDVRKANADPAMIRLLDRAPSRPPAPAIPGADVAGVVVSLGPRVEGLDVGDEVFGEIGGGAVAEYAIGAVDRHRGRALAQGNAPHREARRSNGRRQRFPVT